MKKTGLHEIRKEYLDFFKEQNHLVLKSFPLVPLNDKSLLLINAGMAPLKPYFTGEKKPPRSRMSTCQRCIRTGDIENVGRTARHATYFEMLGNFSFGDYFKKEAISWAWEFLNKRMDIPEEDLWVSIYHEDSEAKEIWMNEIGVKESRIVPLGKEDNFWELEVGPCGPCSEIYVDRGETYGCGSLECKPGCDCDRFIEVWNLVFTQFDKNEAGEYIPLEHPNIDTGMGLERIAAVMQDVDNIFEVKEIHELLDYVVEITNSSYGENENTDKSVRIITDHVRAMTFLVSDGVLPSNEGRGYVLRRLIRRAARHGKLLGVESTFLTHIVDQFIDSWSIEYDELLERRENIKEIIIREERKFQETIDQGMAILESYIEEMSKEKNIVLDGSKAFKLYDTYGFPLDLTKEILEERDLDVDEESFNRHMEDQRQRARQARGNIKEIGWHSDEEILKIDIDTVFEGYEVLETESVVKEIILNNEFVNEVNKSEKAIVILDKTPFYAESGGQIGDLGKIIGNEFVLNVLDTQKNKNGNILHFVEVIEGKVNKNDSSRAVVEDARRKDIMRNHSATHLLHKALKEVLGNHVNQAGSLVLDEKLRFDFSHFEAMTEDQIKKVEHKVNSMIFQSMNVDTLEMTMEESKKMGAIGLFEDNYGDVVRVVNMGDKSIELCGGTHVSNTSEILMFKILGESSVASGVRRIEAITGRYVYKHMNKTEKSLENVASILKSNLSEVENKAEDKIKEIKNLSLEIETMKVKLATNSVEDILNKVKEINNIKFISEKIDDTDMTGLLNLGDKLKEKMNSYIIVLATEKTDGISFISMVSEDLVSRGFNAGKIVKEVSKITGGGGGGRPHMAQAGGKDKSKLREALNEVEIIIGEKLN